MATPLPLHSKLGASSAHRWFECPGSVALCSQMPRTESAFAQEGTNAHTLAELVLRQTPNAFYYVGKAKTRNNPFDFDIDEDMANHVQGYVDHVREVKNSLPGSVLLIEHRFQLSNIHPDLYGTCDAVVYQEFGELHVFDFKYGAGIGVEVEDNEQLMYYSCGALDLGDFTSATMHIVQPRFDHEDGPKRKKQYSIKELIEFGKQLRVRAIATQDENAPLKEGDHCRFCAAAPVCPQLHKRAVDVARTDFKEPKLPEVTALTDEQIAKVIQYAKLIENWFEAVKQHALEKIRSGAKVEGLKLVAGRGRRAWIDEAQAAKVLSGKYGDAAYSKSLLSVAQAEKQLGQNSIEGLFHNVQGSPTVAHESDRRKALP